MSNGAITGTVSISNQIVTDTVSTASIDSYGHLVGQTTSFSTSMTVPAGTVVVGSGGAVTAVAVYDNTADKYSWVPIDQNPPPGGPQGFGAVTCVSGPDPSNAANWLFQGGIGYYGPNAVQFTLWIAVVSGS